MPEPFYLLFPLPPVEENTLTKTRGEEANNSRGLRPLQHQSGGGAGLEEPHYRRKLEGFQIRLVWGGGTLCFWELSSD